jgi:hypothetical protein
MAGLLEKIDVPNVIDRSTPLRGSSGDSGTTAASLLPCVDVLVDVDVDVDADADADNATGDTSGLADSLSPVVDAAAATLG